MKSAPQWLLTVDNSVRIGQRVGGSFNEHLDFVDRFVALRTAINKAFMSIRKYTKLICLACAGTLLALSTLLPEAEAQSQAQSLSQQAYAILKKNCLSCHGAAKTSGLDLRSEESVLAGGENGPVLIPGDDEASKLFSS